MMGNTLIETLILVAGKEKIPDNVLTSLNNYCKDTLLSIWSIEDIKQQDDTLTDEDALEVLEILCRNHDACIGINWHTIDCAIEQYKKYNS